MSVAHKCAQCGIECPASETWAFTSGVRFRFAGGLCLECARKAFRSSEVAAEERDRAALDALYGPGTYDRIYGDDDEPESN